MRALIEEASDVVLPLLRRGGGGSPNPSSIGAASTCSYSDRRHIVKSARVCKMRGYRALPFSDWFAFHPLMSSEESRQPLHRDVQRSAKRRGCLLSYSQAELGRELTQPSPRLLAEPCTCPVLVVSQNFLWIMTFSPSNDNSG